MVVAEVVCCASESRLGERLVSIVVKSLSERASDYDFIPSWLKLSKLPLTPLDVNLRKTSLLLSAALLYRLMAEPELFVALWGLLGFFSNSF